MGSILGGSRLISPLPFTPMGKKSNKIWLLDGFLVSAEQSLTNPLPFSRAALIQSITKTPISAPIIQIDFGLPEENSMERNDREYMWHDLGLQIVLILVMVFMFLHMHDIPRKLFTKFRLRSRSDIQAKRHFVLGAQLLARARSSKTRSASNSLAKEALAEADKAIALDPKDAAAYVLKALALDLQGFRTSALDSLDMALSPLAVKSLADEEKGDALLKRAELKMAMSERGRFDSALMDLIESVKLNSKNVKSFCLLGQCYEAKKMKEEARTAYEEALKVEPQSTVAQEALSRLGS